jgi:glucosamine--fructose-6-phosphate aminotransferase (isomerizing)
MCGISAYIGNEIAFNFIYDSILNLLNRGYDSVGICTIENNELLVHKHASNNNERAETKILKYKINHAGTVGIAHCRWRTNGTNSDNNSHPHNDYYNTFSIVHNGIIDNYKKLKNFLIINDYEFKSETDTEVIINLISYYYKLYSNKNENINENVFNSIKSSLAEVEGTYALAILFKHTPNKIYCIKKGSPLLIGVSTNNDFAMVASEQIGFDINIDNYACLNDDDIVAIERTNNNKIIIHSTEPYKFNKLNHSKKHETHEPFPNWTLKEINDQPETISYYINNLLEYSGDDIAVNMLSLDKYKNELLKIDNLIILACGSSFNAGLSSLIFFKDLCKFNVVQIFDGAFFTENDIPKIGKTALLFISQSGETRDLYEGIQIGKKFSLIMIGVINVENSMISRETQCQVYLNCGREIAVASTKAVTSQIIALSLISIWFSQNNSYLNKNKIKQYCNDLLTLPTQINEILKNHVVLDDVTDIFENRHTSFVISQNTGIAYEGALKIKEMAYIMTEGTFGSSLKHGSFSILDDGFPVIVINNKDSDESLKNYNKMKNIIEEVKSRNAYVINITDEEENDDEKLVVCGTYREKKIKIPNNKTYSSVLSIIILQLIGYKLSKSRNTSIDYPRHLSKTVTV